MKRYLRYLPVLLLGVLLMASCRKEDKLDISDLPDLGGDTWAETPIDQWIYDSLTVPFNMQVKYKFDEFEQDVTRTLTPPKEEKVIPLLRTLRRVWIQTYMDVAGADFFKPLVPKEIVLVGSASYNTDGSIKIGEAEGGKKILLFEVNDRDVTKREDVVRMMHTIEHEFGHILHQTKLYDPSFKSIVPAVDYTANWTNVSDAEAHSLGFVRPYACSGYDDDFVETIATLLVEGQDYYDQLVANTNDEAQTRFREKEAFVVEYFQKEWNIDFRELQDSVQAALNEVAPIPIPDLTEVFGPDKKNTVMIADIQNSPAFDDAYTAAENTLKQQDDSYYLRGAVIRFFTDDEIRLEIGYHSSSDFWANFYFNYTLDEGTGVLHISSEFTKDNGGSNGNGVIREAQLQDVWSFFENKTFVLKWPDGQPVPGSSIQIGGMYLENDSSVFVEGQLEVN